MAAAGLGCYAPDEEAGTEDECVAACEYLIHLGADINAVDKKHQTAMHGAAYKSLPKVAKLLSAKGAKIEVWNQKNDKGWTPLLIAQGFRPGNFNPSMPHRSHFTDHARCWHTASATARSRGFAKEGLSATLTHTPVLAEEGIILFCHFATSLSRPPDCLEIQESRP